MKRALFVFVILSTVLALAQELSQVAVRGTEVNSGVVIITVMEGRSSLELQCNKNMIGCKALEPGNYVLVRLPKNHGMYDCANVEIFASGVDPAESQRIGAYCLIQK